MRSTFLVAVCVMGVGAELSGQGLSGQVTIVTAPAKTIAPLRERSPVGEGSTLRTIAENRAAVYLSAGAGAAVQASLYLEPECSLQIPPATPAVSRHLVAQQGKFIVQYASAGGDHAPLVVSTPAGPSWVRIEPGTLIWIDAAGGDAAYGLIEGSATRFAGGPPTQDPSTIAGGEKLVPQAGLRGQAARLMDSLVRARALVAGMGWIQRAAEGDLVPPPRGLRPLDVAQAQVRVSVTPRTATPTAAAQLPIAVSVTPTITQAQALLSSQSPASVVVGARLERTRIVGNPGSATGTTGLQFNTQVRGPLSLSP